MGRDVSRARCILVVDDDATLLRALVQQLDEHFEVQSTTDTERAASLLCESLHAVVSDYDLGMGSRNGPWLLRIARDRAPAARRILISGQPRMPPAGDEFLWHAMLEKPFGMTELLALLA